MTRWTMAKAKIDSNDVSPDAVNQILAQQTEQQIAPAPTPGEDYYTRCRRQLFEAPAALDYLKRHCIAPAETDIGFDPAWISPSLIARQKAKGRDWTHAPKPVLVIPVTETCYTTLDIRDNLTGSAKKYARQIEGTPDIYGDVTALDGDEPVYITDEILDAISIRSAGGVNAIALNNAPDKLLSRLEAAPTQATLILCGEYADTLRDDLRRLNVSCTVSKTKHPNEALMADRDACIDALVNDYSPKPDNTHDYIDRLMAGEIERFKQSQNRLTGFNNLDAKAGGLYPGLYVLAAATSLGKTTLALQIADQIAMQGEDVLFFSLEQSRLELVSKSLSRLTAQLASTTTAVESLDIRRGHLTPLVMKAVQTYKQKIGDRLSIIEGNFNCDIGFITDYIRTYISRTGKKPTVFIDYLQIVQPTAEGKTRSSRREEIDLAITELKRLTRELDITLIAISALNRTNYSTPIAFESLKESGCIEYTCDVVWGLQLACLDDNLFSSDTNIVAKREKIKIAKDEKPRKIRLVCLKNRYGRSHYECAFDYYTDCDLFAESSWIAPKQTPKQTNARR